MSQRTFGSDASPDLPDLDLNFAELYAMRELISDASYSASAPRLTLLGTLPAATNTALNVVTQLAAGRLASGDTNGHTMALTGYLDDTVMEVSAGSTSGYVSGIVAAARNAVVLPGTVRVYTYGVLRATWDTTGNFLLGRSAQASSGKLEIAGNIAFQPSSVAPTLGVNGDMSFQLVSNTSLKIMVRGSDGTTRSATLTLA